MVQFWKQVAVIVPWVTLIVPVVKYTEGSVYGNINLTVNTINDVLFNTTYIILLFT